MRKQISSSPVRKVSHPESCRQHPAQFRQPDLALPKAAPSAAAMQVRLQPELPVRLAVLHPSVPETKRRADPL